MNQNRNMAPSALERSLAEQAEALEREIAQDVRQQELAIVKKAMAEIAALRGGTPAAVNLTNGERRSPGRLFANRMASSIPEAAKFALEDTGHPLPLGELFPLLANYGRTPTGAKPTWNLSNVMSTHRR